MSTLIAISGLGIICLIIEILNLRKILVPLTVILLLGILGLTIAESHLGESFLKFENYGMIVNTTYTQGFSSLFIILAIFIIIMSPKFYEDNIAKIADYISLKIFMLAGAVAMVSFGNLAMFFIGLEVLSIVVYVLSSSNIKDTKSNEAGLKYFIMGAFASSFVLFGIALIYGAIGSFNIDNIYTASLTGTLPIWFNIGFMMVVVGLLFKASTFPFHFWAPDVYEGSPTLITAMMSTLVKVAAIGTLFKIVSIMPGGMTSTFQTVIIILSILTMTVANITGLRQRNVKRLMAYSGISHAGFMIMTLLAPNSASNAVLYYAAAYSFAGIAAFAVILIVCQGKDNEDISNFHGLFRRQPMLATILSLAMLSMGGIPVLAGFFAKFFVFEQMLQTDHILLVLFGIINSIIAVYYYISIINSMLEKNDGDTVFRVPISSRFVAICAIVFNLILGIFPSIIMNLSL